MMGLCVDIVEVCGCLVDVYEGFSYLVTILYESVVFVFGLLMLWTIDILVPGQCLHSDVKGEI